MIVGGGGPSLTRIDNGAIRGSFRKGKIKGYDTGFSWYSKHAKGHDEASMAYRVKFSAGFDWTKGGKLPGLCGGGMEALPGLTMRCIRFAVHEYLWITTLYSMQVLC